MDLSAKPRPLDIVAKVPQDDSVKTYANTCVCGTTRVFVRRARIPSVVLISQLLSLIDTPERSIVRYGSIITLDKGNFTVTVNVTLTSPRNVGGTLPSHIAVEMELTASSTTSICIMARQHLTATSQLTNDR
ncbi:uncharacterized protein LOC117118462 [Anneissia japonica]|uniref:uncharacterized protein LOC117118462 n=1 Tax=Anneissia japonica TaxID=1529436 RepID=UPI001425662E|nr:uncharacterized protein LOC117118462 [Anneissia japonica]